MQFITSSMPEGHCPSFHSFQLGRASLAQRPMMLCNYKKSNREELQLFNTNVYGVPSAVMTR